MDRGIRGLDQDRRSAVLNGLALMSQLFWGPNPESCQEMLGDDFRSDLRDLAVMLDAESAEAVQAMLDYVGRFDDPDKLYQDLEPVYVSLFVNAPGGVKAPLYHSCYDSEEGLLMGRPAIMMRRRLEEAGLDGGGDLSEPPDHLAVELEYLTLYLDEAFLAADDGMLGQAMAFAAEEMLPWVGQFVQDVGRDNEHRFYSAASLVLFSLLNIAAT